MIEQAQQYFHFAQHNLHVEKARLEMHKVMAVCDHVAPLVFSSKHDPAIAGGAGFCIALR
jgi:hypothetical protein